MASIAWPTVEDAIQNWIVGASGLSEDKVIWSHEGGPRPEAPYISLLVNTLRPIGHDWLDVFDTEDPEPGQEITLKARGHRYCSLSIQCFANNMNGNLGAVAILNDVISALKFHRYTLTKAGVGIAGFGPVATIGNNRIGTALEPRAAVDAQFHLASEVEDFETYIEKVEITNLLTGQIISVPNGSGFSDGFDDGFGG
jgi:hypothetical protein